MTSGLAETLKVKILSEEHFQLRTDDQTSVKTAESLAVPDADNLLAEEGFLVPESQT